MTTARYMHIHPYSDMDLWKLSHMPILSHLCFWAWWPNTEDRHQPEVWAPPSTTPRPLPRPPCPRGVPSEREWEPPGTPVWMGTMQGSQSAARSGAPGGIPIRQRRETVRWRRKKDLRCTIVKSWKIVNGFLSSWIFIESSHFSLFI